MRRILHLSKLDARRFHRRAVLLNSPVGTVHDALMHHGYVQIDPINVCGRMHDLILRNRVAGYREGDLIRQLHGGAGEPAPPALRTAFEHHLPGSNVLGALPVEAWPFLLSTMRHRSRRTGWWSGRLNARQQQLAEVILAELSARGPLSSKDIDDDQREAQGWGTHASLAKTTLHKLFFHGRILIAGRAGNRRLYDLPERVLPAHVLAQPEPSPLESRRWVTLLKLRQRRLISLASNQLRGIRDLVQPVAVEGCPPLYCLPTDIPLLDGAPSPAGPMLLAPLDPLIYDRRLTRQLWGYDYTWEVYTPPAKRVRGYYALPVLAGDELVGHVDPKAQRARKKLVVVNRSVRRGYRCSDAVRGLARFLGLK